jgi:ABC-2 type transport system ATP-binding protein
VTLPPSLPTGQGPAVEAKDLTRRFGAFTAVDRVTFEVERGEIFGYLGANGAGKSTTIRMLTGLLAPSSGTGRVAGFDVETEPEAVKASIGYMSQKFSLYLDLPVRENLIFFGGAYGLWGKALERRAEEVLALADLRDAGDAITGELPGGVRQRLALACAILHRPGVLFLDEPTAGVDPVARRTFWRIIRDLAREGTTVFVTTHYLDEAEYCRRIGLMVDGRLVALDTPAGLKATWVPEQLLVARGRELSRAAERITGVPGVRSVIKFGAGLHLRVDRGLLSAADAAAALRACGVSDVLVEEAEPSLEDVFLAVVGQGDAGAGAGARRAGSQGPGEAGK